MTCTVCHMPAQSLWVNRLLLGTEDRLCPACFALWYDEGLTRREEIQARRQIQVMNGKEPPR